MNANQIINMISRMALRLAMTKGLSFAMRWFAKPKPPVAGIAQTAATPAQTAQSRAARVAAKRARQALKVTRRLGR